jgi:hypothetical protein
MEIAAEPVARRDWRWLLVPLTAFILTRILVFGTVFAADFIMPGYNDTYFLTSNDVAADFVRAWERWDSPWYEQIAVEGYHYVAGEARNTVVFFPLYPLLMRGLMPITGGDPTLAGLVISNAAFLGALVLLYQLTNLLKGDERISERAVMYTAAFPYSLFFSAVYSESLFFLLTLLACYAAEMAKAHSRRWWLVAGLAGLLASATRPTGMLLIFPIGWLWLKSMRQGSITPTERVSTRQDDRRGLLDVLGGLAALVLVPVGALLYILWQAVTFGDAFAFSKSQMGWRQAPGIQPLINDLHDFRMGKLWISYQLDTLMLFAITPGFLYLWRQLGAGYTLYTLFSLLIPLSSGVMSLTRFIAVLFPLFIAFAIAVRYKWLDLLIKIVFLLSLPVFTIFFLKWIFIG